MPDDPIRFDYTTAQTVALLFEVGEKEEAIKIATLMGQRADEMAEYLIRKNDIGRELQVSIVILGELQRVLYQYGEADLAKKLEDSYTKYAGILRMNPAE
jgi:hypothetical protein